MHIKAEKVMKRQRKRAPFSERHHTHQRWRENRVKYEHDSLSKSLKRNHYLILSLLLQVGRINNDLT